MKTTIQFHIDTERLPGYTDEYIMSLWYVAQANPAPIEDADAGQVAEHIGREIIKRWISSMTPPLWNHQSRHAPAMELAALRERINGDTNARGGGQ